MNLVKTPSNIKLVKIHNGWFEEYIARFPTVHDKEEFLKAFREKQEAEKQADEDEIKYIKE